MRFTQGLSSMKSNSFELTIRSTVLSVFLPLMVCFTGLAQTAGTLDLTFDPGQGANGTVSSILMLADGSMLVGGEFTEFDGVTVPYLTRLDSDGSLHPSFNPGSGPDAPVLAIVRYNSTRYLVVGEFTSYAGITQRHAVLIDENGARDASFQSLGSLIGTVRNAAVQNDGKVVLVGSMTSPFNGIVRLNADGTVDGGFNPGSGLELASARVNDVLIQSNGDIVAAGDFQTYDGNPAGRVVRIEPDGQYWGSINNSGTGADGEIFDLEPFEWQKTLITGDFWGYDGNTSTYLANIAVDLGYDVTIGGFGSIPNGPGRVIKLQDDGKFLLGGDFSTFILSSANRLVRVNADGSRDMSFQVGAGAEGGNVHTIAIQEDGGILIGGTFTSYDGVTRNGIARVNGDPCFSQLSGSVSHDGNPVSSGWVFTYIQSGGQAYVKADSVQISNGSYLFPALPVYPSPFILQAVADPTVYPPSQAAPTFYAAEGMSHQWDAPGYTYQLISECNGSQSIDISIIIPESANELPGQSVLRGQVRWADNKVAAEDPIPLIDIVVERVPPGNSVFSFSQTDLDGRYEFVNVPAIPEQGFFYRIYIPFPGIPMDDTYAIEIVNNETVIDNLDFIIDTVANLIFPVGNTNVGLQQAVVSGSLILMPNPMSDRMTVILPSDLTGPVHFKVMDALGRVKVRQTVLQGRSFVFRRDNMASGVYLLEVIGNRSQRMVARFAVE